MKKSLWNSWFLQPLVIIGLFLMILPFPLFGLSLGFKVLWLTGLVLVSRASSFYDNLKVEVHSVAIIAASHVFGPEVGVFMALASAPLQNKVGQFLGSFQKPPWVIVDTVYLIVLSFIASMLPRGQLFFYGLLTIILLGNVVLGTIRVLLFQDPIIRRVMLGVINIIFNYLFLLHFLPPLLSTLV